MPYRQWQEIGKEKKKENKRKKKGIEEKIGSVASGCASR
jgi:hypothetical protein